MGTETAPKDKSRKPRARNSQVVLGALEECLLAVGRARNMEDVSGHLVRVDDLMDEMRRSLNGKKEVDE